MDPHQRETIPQWHIWLGFKLFKDIFQARQYFDNWKYIALVSKIIQVNVMNSQIKLYSI